jgi:hypothetical protein
MKTSEFKSVVSRWSPIIKEIDNDPEIDIEKLTKEEKICLYAHNISKLEKNYSSTNNNLHILYPIRIENTDKQLINNSTLPISLKILKKINDFKNIIIVDSPVTKYGDKNVRVDDIEHSKDISDLLIEDVLSVDDLNKIEDIIITIMDEYFEKLLSENVDKKIFLYIVVQSIRISNNKQLLWRTRLTVI